MKRLFDQLNDVLRYTRSPVQQLEIRKAIRALEVRWAAKRQTDRKHLARIAKSKPSARRKLYAHKMVIYKKDTVDMLRPALPHLHGQGSLRRPVKVHPYREMDTFWAHHKVNVYKVNGRFDVIDAYCNIPILAGITSQRLKKVVQW